MGFFLKQGLKRIMIKGIDDLNFYLDHFLIGSCNEGEVGFEILLEKRLN